MGCILYIMAASQVNDSQDGIALSVVPLPHRVIAVDEYGTLRFWPRPDKSVFALFLYS